MATSANSARQLATLLVKDSEGCRLVAYPDPATGGDPWTIGYGATGPGIHPGVKWTQEQADIDLQARLARLLAKIYPIVPAATNPQLAACISFSYNCGMAAMLGSTWFRKLKQGRIQEAAIAILKWNKAGGKVMAGLTTRRKNESRLLLGETEWLLKRKR